MIFITFTKGKKQYSATVSSFDYCGRNLWIYVWNDDSKGIVGNCGYVPNGKVVSACISSSDKPRITEDAIKVINAWNLWSK